MSVESVCYEFEVDNFGTKAKIETGYKPARNLKPYHTVEKAFYSRDAYRGIANLNEQAIQRYNQRRESYNTVVNLIKKYQLDRSVTVLKKNSETTWLHVQPSGIRVECEALYGVENSENVLFSYDVVDQVVDCEHVYSTELYKLFGIKNQNQVTQSYEDLGDFKYYNIENTENIIKLIAQMRDITRVIFEKNKTVMKPQHFANILTLANLKLLGCISGNVQNWVKYMSKAFTLPEIIYAFNVCNKPEGMPFKPTPIKLLRDYIQLPNEWVKSLEGVNV